MVKRQTWILLAVFVALIGLAFIWTGYQNNQRKSHPTASPTPEQFLFTFDSAAVASLKLTDNTSGKSVMVSRDTAGQWVLVEPQAEFTDIASVEAAVTQLASLRVTSSLTNTQNPAEFGLDKPAYTITININGGGQLLAQVGSATATSSGYYVLAPGGALQIVNKYGLDAVFKLLTNPPVATATVAPTSTGQIAPTVVATATLPAPSSTPLQQPAATGTSQPATSTPELQATATETVATVVEATATATETVATATETTKP